MSAASMCRVCASFPSARAPLAATASPALTRLSNSCNVRQPVRER